MPPTSFSADRRSTSTRSISPKRPEASVEWAKARSHSPSKTGVNARLARAFITVPANVLVGTIHDRMPAIIPIAQHARWLGAEPDPRDLLQPFPAVLIRMSRPPR